MSEQLAGIPGTLSPDVTHLRWIRHDDKPAGRTYRAETTTGLLWAIVSRDPAGVGGRVIWHISISHRDRDGNPNRVPTWDELKHAVYRLIPEDVCMVLIFPRRSAPYVNVYDTCLHLWESEKDIDL